jgi:hypothetical protein
MVLGVKFEPVIVTEEPAAPEAALKLIVATPVTVKVLTVIILLGVELVRTVV